MNRQLFGVFGDRTDFSRFCTGMQFDRVVESDSATIGIRDVGYGIPGRTTVYEDDSGVCLIWGEVVQETPQPPAKRLFERYTENGLSAFGELNGSYLAFVEHGRDALLVTDSIRSWEAFYTDAPGVRVFGTDAAKVTQAIPDPQLNSRTVAEVIYFGTAFGDATVVSGLDRIPFDGYLTPDSTGELRRFVYRPQEFDYAAELARCLQRAIERRISLPGRKGLLLDASTGSDSRIIPSLHPALDAIYTIGSPSGSTLVARNGVEHTALPISERRLDIRPEVIQYTQGIRESLHIRHRGNTSAIDADTIYHEALFDTLLRGRFLPRREIELFGCTITLSRLDSDLDAVKHIASRFGYYGLETALSNTQFTENDTSRLPRELIEPRFESCQERADSVHNAIDLFSIKQSPTLAFRTHLADHFLESFIAADRELIEWHLTTPPEHRTGRTFRAALERLDSEMSNSVFHTDQLGTVLERIVPGRTISETPRPDLDERYGTNNLDGKLFPGYEEIHSLPPRLKLRMNDLITWTEYATGDPLYTPDQLLMLPF